MPEYLEESVYNKLKQTIKNIVKEYNEQNTTNFRLINARNPIYYDQIYCYNRSLLPDFKQYVIDFMLDHIPDYETNPEHAQLIRKIADKIYNLQKYFEKIGNKEAELNVHQACAMNLLEVHIRLSRTRDQTLYPCELRLIQDLDSYMNEKYSKEIELMNNDD